MKLSLLHATIATLSLVAAAMSVPTVGEADEPKGPQSRRELFSFEEDASIKAWQAVNDGVMGGRSIGRVKRNDDGTAQFFGVLSLENNGGFASMRSRPKSLGLAKGDVIVARVKGDGRKYTLNLYTPSNRVAFSYRLEFPTRKGEWIEIRAPLDQFVATWFGRTMPNQALEPSVVNRLGILLGDKKAGAFRLDIDWIKVAPAPAPADR